jgi:hypothetical protein
MRDFLRIGLLRPALFALCMKYRVETTRATGKARQTGWAVRDRGIKRLEAVENMTSRIIGALGGLFIGLGASAAFAQSETECVSAKTDWSVCVWQQPKECWGVSKPKETVNSKDGQVVSARRGDILMFVTFRPGTGAKGEVSFTGGYPFASGSPVNVNIDGKSFDMISDGEWAWPTSPSDDAGILAAMKAGGSAIVTARSGRGTQTKDTFSLLGFTAAMAEAEQRCK